MIICVCNSISDKAINTAVTSGANTPSLVYKSCGAKPQCGSCTEYIKQEINQVQITETNNLKNIAKDLASLGEIRARLMASKKLNSLNFSIDVVNNIAYISGIASSEEEVAIVSQIAQEARFIKEVQNFVKVNKDKR